jgi:succinate-acetate transporter protein
VSDRLADPKALGFAAFGILAWMYSMLDAGWYGLQSAGGTFVAVTAFAAIALFIAALVSFLRGETWHAVFFMFWTAVTWGLRATLATGGMQAPTAYGGWYFAAIALVSLFLFFGAFKASVGAPVVLLSLGVTLAFTSWALEGWLGGDFWLALGGYIGLATGLAGLWATAGALSNLDRTEAATPA